MSGCINPPQNCTSMSWKQTDFCLKLHKTFSFFTICRGPARRSGRQLCVSIIYLRYFEGVSTCPKLPTENGFHSKRLFGFLCKRKDTHLHARTLQILKTWWKEFHQVGGCTVKMYDCMTTSDGLSLSSGQMKHPRRWSHYKSLWNCCCCWWWWWCCLYFSEMVYTTWFDSVIVKNVITHEIKFMLLE